jgi:transcriptional antiterminator
LALHSEIASLFSVSTKTVGTSLAFDDSEILPENLPTVSRKGQNWAFHSDIALLFTISD